MGSMEEFIKTQNRIREQFMAPTVLSTMDRKMLVYANAVNQFQSIQVEPALLSFMNELQKYREMHEAVFKSFLAVQQILNPVLEEYNRVSEFVSVARKVQESIQPITNCLKDIQPVLPNTKLFSQLNEIRNRMLVEPSVLLNLQEVIESQINSSLWEYAVESDEFGDSFADEIQEDILYLAETEDKAGFLNQFLAKWEEKGKAIIVSVIKWVMITFVAGLMEHWCEPVYKVLTPSFLLQEENVNDENKTEIPVNTEIHVWNEVTNNFIEITYKIGDKEYQGYMEHREFESNTEKISDEVELEHIVFINNVTQLLSEKWNIQPKQVYSFLKDDTELLEDYLLKHYDVLDLLDEADLVENIEKHCQEQGIAIPVLEECEDCEFEEVE